MLNPQTATPKDWKKISLEKECWFERGMEPGADAYNAEGTGERFIRVVDVTESRENSIFVNGIVTTKRVKKDDILLTLDGTIGAVRKGLEGIYSTGIRKVSFREKKNSNGLLYHLLQSENIQHTIDIYASGSTIRHASSAIPYLFANLPESVKEQEKIADIFNQLEEAINKTNTLIEKYKCMRMGMMQDLFRFGVDVKGQIRNEKTHKFKNSPLGYIPEEWKIGGFEFVKHRTRPFIKTGPFGSSLKGEHWVEEGTPVITIGALGEGEFIKSELFFITKEKAKSLEAYRVQSGDLVFSRVADVGRSVVVSNAEQDWIMSSNLMRIALDNKKALPQFTHLNIVHNQKTRAQIRALINAGGREVANTAFLNSLIFAWPTLDEQKRICEAVASLENAQSFELKNKQKMNALKNGLMKDLITGTVRV
jgi:type I restriction enzyme S subunit